MELDCIYNEVIVGMNKSEWYQLINYVWDKRFQFIYIDTTKPFSKMYHKYFNPLVKALGGVLARGLDSIGVSVFSFEFAENTPMLHFWSESTEKSSYQYAHHMKRMSMAARPRIRRFEDSNTGPWKKNTKALLYSFLCTFCDNKNAQNPARTPGVKLCARPYSGCRTPDISVFLHPGLS
eukprot:COSAG02_NODE_2202_length_9534_cov_20.277160_12_plen_179_part_00